METDVLIIFFRKEAIVRNVKLSLQDKNVNQILQCNKVCL